MEKLSKTTGDVKATAPSAIVAIFIRGSRMTAKTLEEDDGVFEFFEQQLKAPFSPNKIKWRASNFNGNKSPALLYLDARDVMDRLDEVFGIGRWSTKYVDLDTRAVCTLSVSFNGWGWVEKADVGTQSTFEGEKGMYSDALKRAAVQFGVGRYLYDDEVLQGKSFETSNKKFTPESNDEIYAFVESHFRTYSNAKSNLLKSLFQSATTLEELKKYYAENKKIVEELKAEDSDSALYVAKIFKQRGSALKRVEKIIHG